MGSLFSTQRCLSSSQVKIVYVLTTICILATLGVLIAILSLTNSEPVFELDNEKALNIVNNKFQNQTQE